MSDKNGGLGSFSTGLLVGGFMGAAIAVLIAPRSGEETREQIRARSSELRDTAERTVDDALATIKTMALDVSNRAEELRVQSQAALDEAQQQWTQAIEDIKQVAAEAIEETRTAAVVAGNEGDEK